MTARAPGQSLLDRLHAAVPAQRVLTSGDEYESARALWNGAVTIRPAAVVQCVETADVQRVLRAARDLQVPVTVRGGGHDWAGRALAEDAVVLDLRRMNAVTVDPVGRTARVGGGATNADVVKAADHHGLSAVTGVEGSVGFAGLTLGGGYGSLLGAYGLAADSLLAADVVLADGRIVRADAGHEPDLFWALRGGGGNFGVVTALTIRLHDLPAVVAGTILYPWRQARTVLRGLAGELATAPDGLTLQGAIGSNPEGELGVILVPTWAGSTEAGLDENGPVGRLAQLGTPDLAVIAPTTPARQSAGVEGNYPPGQHVIFRSRLLPVLSDPVIDVLIEQAQARTSASSAVAIRHFHGAAARIPESATAFAHRQAHLETEIVAMWDPDELISPAERTREAERHRGWAERTSQALAPHSLPGGYTSLLGPEAHDQISRNFGGNTGRLLAVKAAYDPEGVFTAIPLPVAVPADRL